MKQLTAVTILLVGMLLGVLLSYLVLQDIIPKPHLATSDPYRFMQHSQHLLRQSEIIQPLLCAKLASDLDIKIDYSQLHHQLEQRLAPFNEQQKLSRELLIYLKGYAFGLVHGIDDKQGIFDTLQCQQWQLPNVKTKKVI